ncbi:OmpA family protein [Streptomyces scabiei]|uniref:OmpA family protein n=1 Tax=Streptomyces scabiei TaxID=1930 RepID=UPI0029B28BA9|nr:OmpA family protein [Streptomyces scabiei]MDX2576819.1 OmpA family protein [Streptomyces scabiei]MDX3030680.1 OmpA family protein [Streptomyces scabiei]MDX3204808.1 OmpA family protein [Streptomyces scabiei]
MRPTRPRVTASLLALTALAAALGASSASAQQAAASSHRGSSGLALRSGATLAPPKILDLASDPVGIGRVVGDQDGAERRRDTNTKVTYELQAEVLFTKDSARLSDAARSRIIAIAREIEQRTAAQVRVSGFTDNLGSSAHGDMLSTQRADAVRAVLAAELHSTAVVFETRGFGERHPVASNATEAGRKKNRRVEVSFV